MALRKKSFTKDDRTGILYSRPKPFHLSGQGAEGEFFSTSKGQIMFTIVKII
ncbi:hypothetical protein [Melghirimyces profundicolus]|uniref:hypothetical protein n=1 Tax=Melghirimyces profundicolus TaxID=1242148 RepID=UPI001473C364|nr:hypothetical protein [Melghirimyces profundicolus]